MNMKYQHLKPDQINQLITNGCTCSDWGKIRVSEGFSANHVQHTDFSGEITIGDNQGTVEFYGGVKKPCGIYNSSIHNCTIGNHVYINHVTNYIANYDIEDHVIIENLELCAMEGESCFGNGFQVEVLDETGGRKIMIYDYLSAHLAYIMAFYKHRSCAIEMLEKMIIEYSEGVKSSRGIIGRHSKLQNCRQIRNVRFGPYTQANGVNRLENGSVNGNQHAPVILGTGITAQNFIFSSGSEISDGTIIANCFIGQGCILSKQYSAENSLFFANCQGFHGEACAVFAGPYTVTHHKSTLLIAGMFSFCNAGSGSNQSNHMYKLGPIHHGVVERGSKTTSDSYLLWPAKIGAYTLVMGRHYKNIDTSDLPFSYLIENKDDSWLAPAVNLQSVGTIRDVMKWPRRDRRKDPKKQDCINFNLLSPFTIQKMLNGLEILKNLKQVSGETTDTYAYHSTLIKRHSLERGIDLYSKAMYKFIGNSIISRLDKCGVESFSEIMECLKPRNDIGSGNWSDLAGLIAPQTEVRRILNSIENSTFVSLEEIENEFRLLHQNYYDYEWVWAAGLLKDITGKAVEELNIKDLIDLIGKWQESVVEIDNLLYKDAQKEFRLDAMTGFGMDGNKATQKLDFEKVRGNFEDNDFVKEILDHIERKTALGKRIINRLENIEKLQIQSTN
ncbi:MAG: DUF4954 domain-containing protein [Bacteroidetes bacterium GWF2_42_66]|nr:MAG: DUF4954 domain-containing protein [Bacteroidetes bacterium GWA2_42_15]OFY02533.1 MAG: DUF4954 domain-containing protein [Bacteroidetes bacterium GWE2_42_39]OFY41369.1 MAG: DUF4954 domain-containing protein [Bacteroidetes bacterium GWF2_42_66]HBL75431.1 DUF4954 domain-containing protein [Prolixibacteraceae bacterium]HCU60660.1 DUF4954 domain-containing protein [Prolixibacteraceae bacterium]